MNWTCTYCSGVRDARHEQCPGCGAARTVTIGRESPKPESIDRERELMDYMVSVASLGPDWAKLVLGDSQINQFMRRI